jgi:hypothetical protein
LKYMLSKRLLKEAALLFFSCVVVVVSGEQ